MKLLFKNLKEEQTIEYNSLLGEYFDNDQNKIIKKINLCNGEIHISRVDHIVSLEFNILFNLDVVSSYSLEVFAYDVKINDKIYVTDDENFDDGEIIYVGDSIDLDNIVYSLLLTSIPMDLHKKDEKLPKTDTYSVLTEEEYLNKKNADKTSPFDILKDIDLDSK